MVVFAPMPRGDGRLDSRVLPSANAPLPRATTESVRAKTELHKREQKRPQPSALTVCHGLRWPFLGGSEQTPAIPGPVEELV